MNSQELLRHGATLSYWFVEMEEVELNTHASMFMPDGSTKELYGIFIKGESECSEEEMKERINSLMSPDHLAITGNVYLIEWEK